MSWRDEVRPASFRGVGFEALELSGESGRRVVADELPETDTLPATADLGKKRASFRLRGFVVGLDYLDRKERLLAALNAYGPGDLVHPWRGQLRVQVRDVSHKHDLQHGVCMVEFDCVEAGGMQVPFVEVVADRQAAAKAALANSSANDHFGPAGAGTGSAWMAEWMRLAQAARYAVNAVSDNVYIDDLFDEGIFTSETWGLDTVSELAAAVALLTDVRGLLAFVGTVTELVLPSAGTPSEEARNVSMQAVGDSIRTLAVIRAAELTAAQSFVSADAAEATMAEVAGVLNEWIEGLAAGDLFMAMTDLRAAMVDALTQAASRLPRERKIIVGPVTPAIVIAYDTYGSRRLERREAELIQLNGIGHAGMVVTGPVKVLSR